MTDIERLTSELRLSDDPLFERLRELLSARGVDPSRAWLIEMFPDDAVFEFGILITSDRRVFQFGYGYLNREVGDGELEEWVDYTVGWHLTPYYKVIEDGLYYLSDPS
jgi:hypothetical protein